MPRIRIAWSRAVEALVLVKFGQELGTDSRLARAIHDAIEILLAITK